MVSEEVTELTLFLENNNCEDSVERLLKPWLVRLSRLSQGFDSWSAHMTGLQVRSPVRGMQEAVSLPLFFPPFPSILKNK